MTPFNLEKALSGAPVVTRLGWKVKIDGYHPDHKYRLIGWVFHPYKKSWLSCEWGLYGTIIPFADSVLDLFMMDTTKKTGFINIFHPVVKLEQTPNTREVRGVVYDTEDLAKNAGAHKEGYIATVPVEWEEI